MFKSVIGFFAAAKRNKVLLEQLQKNEALIGRLTEENVERGLNVRSLMIANGKLVQDKSTLEGRVAHLLAQQTAKPAKQEVVATPRREVKALQGKITTLRRETDLLVSIKPQLVSFAKAFADAKVGKQDHNSLVTLNDEAGKLGDLLITKGFAK